MSELAPQRRQLREDLSRDIALLREAYRVKVQALELLIRKRTTRVKVHGESRLAAELRRRLAALPPEFGKEEVERLVGSAIERSTLYRAYRALEEEGLI